MYVQMKGNHKLTFFTNELTPLIEENNYKIKAENIGEYGENLSICILNTISVEKTIRLISSIRTQIPHFQGELIVVHFGMDEEKLSQIATVIKNHSFKYQIIEQLGSNVSEVMNMCILHSKKEWVLFLDSEYFLINNPLPKIMHDISLLGCHFLNLPLLDSDNRKVLRYGGDLLINFYNNQIGISGSFQVKSLDYREMKTEMNQPFLSNYFYGIPAVVKNETFLKLGGFDVLLNGGHENIDFSIRLFRGGYKIGNSCTLSIASDCYEEIVRYDEKSGERFEEKYGLKLFDLSDNKMNEKEFAKNPYNGVNNHTKTRIALIVDVEDWAFWNISQQIVKHLSDYFDFEVIPIKDCDYNTVKLLLRTYDCKVLHFFWRGLLTIIDSEESFNAYFGQLPISSKEFYRLFYYEKIISTCVYDHLFLEDSDIERMKCIFNKIPYYVSSEKLDHIYKSISQYKKPVMVIEDGVDPEYFYPINLDRFNQRGRPLVIGWVGNSKWANEVEDYKGFHSILKPAIEHMQKEGLPVVGLYSDRNDVLTPHREMVYYYQKIDVLVCVSKIEGTPNPVLEAMACGVPVISTDVGIVPQVFGPLQKEFILKKRDINHLKEAVQKLLDNPDLLLDLSKENLEYIKPWFWVNQCKKFKSYFEFLINR